MSEVRSVLVGGPLDGTVWIHTSHNATIHVEDETYIDTGEVTDEGERIYQWVAHA
jgi:hypothetical protein